MIHITFNGSVCLSLKKMCPKNFNSDNIFMLFLPLEVGNIATPENSKTNKVVYDILAGSNAYENFKAEAERTVNLILQVPKQEEVCFWVDFNDVKQHLNFAYFMKIFEAFENKSYVEFDFNKYCESPDAIYGFFARKKVLSEDLVSLLESELLAVQKNKDMIFRTAINKVLVSVRDDYFDKFIIPFLDEKPKSCMQIIGEIFSKFGRLVVSFDQVVIRLWLLFREGVVERVGPKTERDLFFEYKYKLSDHIDMQRDS